jgi:hypothetical protein
MTDLTELWQKGELPSGWYYVRLIRGEYRIDLYINGKNEWIDCPDNIIDTVVCEVPSYEEYQKLLSDQLAKIEGEEIVAELEERLKKTQELELELRKENAQMQEELSRESYKVSEAYCYVEELKELLKECKPYVHHRFMRTKDTLLKPYTPSDKVLNKKAEKLLTKIDEVLK